MRWLVLYLVVSTVATLWWARVGWVLRGPSVDQRAEQARAMVTDLDDPGLSETEAWTENPR